MGVPWALRQRQHFRVRVPGRVLAPFDPLECPPPGSNPRLRIGPSANHESRAPIMGSRGAQHERPRPPVVCERARPASPLATGPLHAAAVAAVAAAAPARVFLCRDRCESLVRGNRGPPPLLSRVPLSVSLFVFPFTFKQATKHEHPPRRPLTTNPTPPAPQGKTAAEVSAALIAATGGAYRDRTRASLALAWGLPMLAADTGLDSHTGSRQLL